MPRSFRRLTGLLAALLLSLTLAASAAAEAQTSPATAPPPSSLEAKIEALERRLEALERVLALSTINVPVLVEKAGPSVVSLYQVDEDHDVLSEGTGFLWTADGKIITATPFF